MNANPKHTGLADALRAVLEHRASDRHWQLVRRGIAEAIRLLGFANDLDDPQQEVCIKLLRTSSRFHGNTDAEAFAFLRAAARNVIRDALRAERSRPRPVRSREGDVDPVERVRAQDPQAETDADREAAAADLLDHLLTEVDSLIERSGKTSVRRELAWRQANATVCARLRGMEAGEIAAELGVLEVSSACIHKWVERGRPLLLAALDALAQGADPDEQGPITHLRAALAKRRTDAGKPRPKKPATKKPATKMPGAAK